MQIHATTICGGTSRELVVGGHEAFSKSAGFLGFPPQLLYPIFAGMDVERKAAELKTRNADMVIIEFIKEIPEDVIAETISKVLAVWEKAFCIGAPNTDMLEFVLSQYGRLNISCRKERIIKMHNPFSM